MLLPRSGYLSRPWRNGGGISHEIAWAENEDWRLGLAEIDRDGPFSDYTGFDRTLTVVQGEGLRLNEDALGRAPHSFRGEEPVMATVTAGPVLVLNAITRRGRFTHRVERRAARGTLAGASYVTAIGGEVTIAGERLAPLDTLRLGDAELSVEASEAAEILAIWFFEA
jgi:hypothetical protein